MKRILLLNLLGLAGIVQAIDLSGKYSCNGYDTKDGAYKNDVVILEKVGSHSHPEKDVFSYNFQLRENGRVKYSGSAASHGQNLAIYFENTDKGSIDKGVGIARVDNSILRNEDGSFKQRVTFSKFYYEQAYDSDGSEFCTKL